MAKATHFDVSEYLDSPEAIAEYLNAALETNDAVFIIKSLNVIARAKGMTSVARSAGLSRENLYRSLNGETKPEFATILSVIKALGLDMHAEPQSREHEEARKRAMA